MPKATVKDIVAVYLKQFGYDGLYGEECGCEASDLMPCGQAYPDCRAGYRMACTPDCENYRVPLSHFHIGPEKPSAPSAQSADGGV